ncbi:MAG: ribosomal subunit interface protein [Ignavibacteriae bacterium]|nr:MAG: ribosomal subunit interface protein [Ignavibacteriota bacterium]
MNIQITSRKFKAKESLKTEINEQLKSLEKFNNDILDANVVLSYLHNKDSLKTVEIILNVPGKTLSAEVTSEEFNKSLNSTIDKLERQLKKLKTKKKSQIHK